MKPGDIVSLYDQLYSEKGTVNRVLYLISKYVTPNKHDILSVNTPGTSQTLNRYTSAAEHAARLLAGSIQGAMTPLNTLWQRFKTPIKELNETDEVQDWLYDCSERMHDAYRASNYYTKSHEALLDLVSSGTNSLLQEQKPVDEFGNFTGLKFDTFGTREYVIINGDDDIVVGVIRKMKLTAQQIHKKLSSKAGFKSLSKKIMDALNSSKMGDHTKKFDILHAIIPRDFINREKSGALNMPYMSQYIAHDEKHLLSDGGYLEFPLSVARWDKQSDDDGWGRSPAWVVLPEILTLNNVKEKALINLAKEVSPPILVPHKGLVGGLRVTPNAINVYRKDANKPEYFNSGSRVDITQFREEEIKKTIEMAFFTDQLQLPEDREMTAYETSVRVQLIQRLIGPTFHRLTHEFYDPQGLRSFNIMLRGNAFKPVPEVMKQYANANGELDFEIEYLGTLARSQRLEEVQSIQSTYQIAAEIVAARGGDSAVMDNLDDDEALRVVADQGGLPAKILRDKELIAQERQQRQEAAQQQAQLDQAQQAGEVENVAAQTAVT